MLLNFFPHLIYTTSKIHGVGNKGYLLKKKNRQTTMSGMIQLINDTISKEYITDIYSQIWS